MAKKYSLIYKSPEVECSVQADTLSGLESAVSARITRVISSRRDFSKMSLDEAANKTLEIYRDYQDRHGRRPHTGMKKAGVELDAIKCYLQDMKYAEIIEWIKENKGVTISMSAMGRFCATLRLLNIRPIEQSK